MRSFTFFIDSNINLTSLIDLNELISHPYANSVAHYALLISQSDGVYFTCSGVPRTLNKNEIYFFRPNDIIQFTNSLTFPEKLYLLSFEYAEPIGASDSEMSPLQLPTNAYTDNERFYSLLDEISDEIRYDAMSYKPRRNILLCLLLLVLSRHCKQKELKEGLDLDYTRSSKHVKRIIDYLHDNYQSDVSGEMIKAHIGLDYSYANSVFKKALNMTIMQYLDYIRIERAKDLLTHTNLKVGEICKLVGISDPQYFSNKFKTIAHITPLKYRMSFHNQ